MRTTYCVAGIQYSAELYHHGIKGQKWGIRRYQNEDGTLTSAGKQRYNQSTYKKELGFNDNNSYVENYLTYHYAKNMEKGKKCAESAWMYKAMAKDYNKLPKRNRDEMNKKVKTIFGNNNFGYAISKPIVNDRLAYYFYYNSPW